MSRKMIPIEESFAEWRKDPEYVEAYMIAVGTLVTERPYRDHLQRRAMMRSPTRNRGPDAFVDRQTEHAAGLDSLLPSLEHSVTAEALHVIVGLDLSDLAAVEPPRGYGKD